MALDHQKFSDSLEKCLGSRPYFRGRDTMLLNPGAAPSYRPDITIEQIGALLTVDFGTMTGR